MDRRKWPQISELCAFNNKLYIESFFYKYLSIYIVRYFLSTSKKCSWAYTYASMIDEYC